MGCWFSKAAADKKPPPYDYYRSGPLRYLGYAGHVGSACSMLLPQSVVHVPQMAATAYICADVFNETVKSSEKGERHNRVVVNAFDALIWQALASVLIPGLVFNGLRSTTKQLFVKQTKGGPCGGRPVAFSSAPLAARLIPCMLALLATPFIVQPIDRGVDYIMNNTYRVWTAPSPDDLRDPREVAKEQRLKAEKAEKEAREKAKKAEKEAIEKAKKAEKEALEKAKKEEKERLEKIKREEKEAKEKARQKCMEEAKALKEKLAAEEREMNEKLKKEEADLKERQAKLAQDMKEKAKGKMECD